MVKFCLNEELFTENYRATGINVTTAVAFMKRGETGNNLMDFDDEIHETDVPEIIDTLKRRGESEFTISSGGQNLVKILALFDKYGAKMNGIIEINSVIRSYNPIKRDRIPAILMRVE